MKMIIMAGGSGTRLWPLSRTHYPKQFLKLSGMEKSIFQLTVERCLLMGCMEDIYIVTGRDYLHLIQGQIEEIGKVLQREHILLEPEPKNTLPAILCAVQAIRESDDDICAVLASDHVIDNPQILAETVLSSAECKWQAFFSVIRKGVFSQTRKGLFSAVRKAEFSQCWKGVFYRTWKGEFSGRYAPEAQG